MGHTDAGAARGQAPAPRVGRKLRNAFLGVAFFSLLSAMVGIGSYRSIESAQSDALDRALPAILAAERLAKGSLAVVAASPGLLLFEAQAEFGREREKLAEAEADAKKNLMLLNQLGAGVNQRTRLEGLLDEVFGRLFDQTDLAEERFVIARQLAADEDRAISVLVRIIALLAPYQVEAYERALDRTAEVRAALARDATISPALRGAFDQLTERDFTALEQIAEMRFRAETLHAGLESLRMAQDQGSVLRLRNAFTLGFRDLARFLFDAEAPALQGEIAPFFRELTPLIEGSDNLFERRLQLIDLLAELDRLAKATRFAASDLKAALAKLLAAADRTIEGAADKARDAVTLGQVLLSLIAVIAFLVAVYVTWRFVVRDIATRIRKLSDTTRSLAAGDLDVQVDVTGDDELSEMADAVRVFRSNATALRRSNTELQQFAYVASHDLKAPLRGIANLADWIEQDLSEAMNDETRHHMMLLKGRVTRLETLLEDLLQYSRAGREEAEVREVDVDRMVLTMLGLMGGDSCFTMVLETHFPTFRTAATPLDQIFRNLIGNAIKHHDRERGRITLSVEDLGTHYAFSVADDGPGIRPEHQERIFRVFQTLQSRDTVEGSGMGLALIRKLVEAVDCTIEVESDPEKRRGSTFRFTWPKVWPQEPELPDTEGTFKRLRPAA